MVIAEDKELLPAVLKINQALEVSSIEHLVLLVTCLTDSQVYDKSLDGIDENIEFAMACDALSVWRLRMRLVDEFGEAVGGHLTSRLAAQICADREYEHDDFEMALVATQNRARLPFGMGPLQL